MTEKKRGRSKKDAEKTTTKATTEPVAKKLPAHKNPDVQFKAGQSGNPKGRTKGSKNVWSIAVDRALGNDFAKYGVKAIVALRQKDPGTYLNIVSKRFPPIDASGASVGDGSTPLLDMLKSELNGRRTRLEETECEPEGDDE